MKKGSIFGIFLVICLAAYVLFDVSDPKELYDGFVTLIKKIADKGAWVRDLWSFVVKGDLSGIWKFVKDSFFDSFNIFGSLGGLFK